jgi:release factor glutamine methyltransferase
VSASVDAALAAARARGLERLDAQLLVAHVTGRSRAWLIAHGDAVLDATTLARLAGLVERRAQGEPLAYLVGEKEFHGLALQVDARVLVPRPETELLVDWAIECLREPAAAPARVVDLGTGSGAIALALKADVPTAEVTATDLSDGALSVAQANARRHGLDLRFAAGRWWEAVAADRFSLAVSNPPYIAAADPHLAALRMEPQSALTPGASGLEALHEIIDGAPARLDPGGWLLLEHGHDQAEAVRDLLNRRGFTAIQTRHDLAGLPRCTGGRR